MAIFNPEKQCETQNKYVAKVLKAIMLFQYIDDKLQAPKPTLAKTLTNIMQLNA